MSKIDTRMKHADRIEQALARRAQRATWTEVAAELGWSCARSACRAVSRYTASHPTPGIEQIRDECRAELVQSARELHKIIRDLRNSDYAPSTIAKLAPPLYTELRQTNESIRRLDGADKATKISLEGDDRLDEEVEAYWAEIVAHLQSETAP